MSAINNQRKSQQHINWADSNMFGSFLNKCEAAAKIGAISPPICSEDDKVKQNYLSNTQHMKSKTTPNSPRQCPQTAAQLAEQIDGNRQIHRFKINDEASINKGVTDSFVKVMNKVNEMALKRSYLRNESPLQMH